MHVTLGRSDYLGDNDYFARITKKQNVKPTKRVFGNILNISTHANYYIIG